MTTNQTPPTEYWDECSQCRQPCTRARRQRNQNIVEWRSACHGAPLIARTAGDSRGQAVN